MAIKSVLYICLNITRTLKYAWAEPEGIWSYVGRQTTPRIGDAGSRQLYSVFSLPSPCGTGRWDRVPNFDMGP